MNKIQWFFMSDYDRLMYTIKLAQKYKLKIDLLNGVVLDFSNNTIKQGVNYKKLAKKSQLHNWRW
jgi:hypothetical protein